MANLVEWIEEAAEGDTIYGVVIGEMCWGDYGSEDVPGYADCPKGQLLTWEEARPRLDYEFDDGYGAPGCQAVYVWTGKQVLFVSNYDGSTCMMGVPRHPIAVMPGMAGGG